jgi:hypothetical protein
MRRKFPLFKILFATVGMLAIAAFALHFHITRQIDRELASVASQVAPFATLDWGSIQIHPSGQIRIRDLSLAPHMVAGELRIGQLAFTAPNLIELLQATREFDQGRLPPALGLSIRSLQVPIEGSGLERMEIPVSTGLPFEAAGCEGRDVLNIGDLPNLDIWNLTGDVSIDYRLLGNGESMTLRVSSFTQYMAGLHLDARLHLGSASRDRDLLARAWSMARLEKALISYRNLGFRDRLDRFCAGRMDMTPQQFREHHLAAWLAAWTARGLAPDAGVVAAYRDFVNDPRDIELTLEPEQRMPLTAFTRLEREQLLDELKPSVSVNAGRAASVRFDVVPIQLSPFTAPQALEAESEERVEATTRRRNWVEAPVAGLTGRVGEFIRVTTSGGERINGELVEMDGEYLHVRIRGTGGFHIRPISRQRIASVEVRD